MNKKITEKQQEVYKKLFHITEENMRKDGFKMEVSDEAFFKTVGASVREIDIAGISEISPMAFLQVCYILMLHRFPEDKAIEKWDNREDASDYEFKRTLVEEIKRSAEFHIKSGTIINNIFTNTELAPAYITVRSESPGLRKLRSQWEKLPEWMKKIMRRVFGG